jgi:class 3 adenylate cyclase
MAEPTPLAYLDGPDGSVPIYDQLFVGRVCAGIAEHRRLIIPDPEISSTHLEIRLDTVADQAFVIDTSSNGTLLNWARLERAVALPIKPGDEIRISRQAFTFRSQRFTAVVDNPSPRTRERVDQFEMVKVVGDIVNYSTIAQVTDERVMARSLQMLWHGLRRVMHEQRGTLSHYAGDAVLAVWEMRRFPNAAELAIEFALAADRLVTELAPQLPLRGPDGLPIRMGWGVVQGMAAVAAMTRSTDAVIGDSANVAFRLAGLAGRQGRAAVLVTSGVRRAVKGKFAWGESELVEIKGRRGTETVFPILAS